MSAIPVLNELSKSSAAAHRRSQNGPLEIDEADFRRNFNRKPFPIRHNLTDHPLFSLPRLIELSTKLPEKDVMYNAGDIPVSQYLDRAPRTGLSIQQTIRRIEECRSWMVLKRVEQDPDYCALLDSCLDHISRFSEPIEPGMSKREGFIFITSPGSITPYHMDPETNFLLQIRGQKSISIFDPGDRTILPETELEDFYSDGNISSTTYKEEFEEKAYHFQLLPGSGVHFPVVAPHWVKNGNEVSISFSITFRTASSERRALVYTVNAGLRKRGINPTPVGRSAWRDAAKYFSYRAFRRARHILGKAV